MLKHIRQSIAFTLAEVLIVLGILGIIAEITIPSLVHNFTEAGYTTSLQVAYSIFNSAFNTLKAQGYDLRAIDGTTVQEKSATLTNQMTSVMKYAKVETGDKIYSTTYYKAYKNNTPTVNTGACTSSSCVVGVLANGMVFQVQAYNGCRTNVLNNMNVCVYLEVDINGNNQPNMGGEDLFDFFVTDNYQVIALGDPRMVSPYYCQVNAPDWTHTRGCTWVRLYDPNNLP